MLKKIYEIVLLTTGALQIMESIVSSKKVRKLQDSWSNIASIYMTKSGRLRLQV